MTTPDPEETWKPIGEVLRGVAGKLIAAQSNKEPADAPSRVERGTPPEGEDKNAGVCRRVERQRVAHEAQKETSANSAARGTTTRRASLLTEGAPVRMAMQAQEVAAGHGEDDDSRPPQPSAGSSRGRLKLVHSSSLNRANTALAAVSNDAERAITFGAISYECDDEVWSSRLNAAAILGNDA